MKTFTASIGAIALTAFCTAPAWAGNLSAMPNTFTAGQKAVAADVNANFNALRSEVNDNDSRITTNATAISSNTTAITANTTHSTGDGTDHSAVADNITAIGNNANNITTNASAINANTTAINANTTHSTGDGTDHSAVADNITAIGNNGAAITALQNGTSPCPSDMAKVGSICVDIYEATVWNSASGGTQVANGDWATGTYPCSKNGNNCKDVIFARSVSGYTPAAGLSWFQAQQACANVGKRLLTNAEWQMAAAGTVDPGSNNSITGTNTQCHTAGGLLRNTGLAGSTAGGASDCISSWGVQDMVGNVSEWVADWIQGATAVVGSANTSADYGGDGIADIQAATNQGTGDDDFTAVTNFPAGIYRGGDSGDGTSAGVFAFYADGAPTTTDAKRGFRCAR